MLIVSTINFRNFVVFMHGHFTVLYGVDDVMNSLLFVMDDLVNSPSPIVWTINFHNFIVFMHRWLGDVGYYMVLVIW